MIRGAVEGVAGLFLWPFQALFMRWDNWQAMGEWDDEADHEPQLFYEGGDDE